MTRQATQFLQSINLKLSLKGHTLGAWIKGRWGFSVSDKRVREFPEDTCQERLASLAQYEKEWKEKHGDRI